MCYSLRPARRISPYLKGHIMKRIGILVGREKTFPDALIGAINERGKGETIAEFMKLGGIRHDAPPHYDLVVDRISHEGVLADLR